jgi:hypothetical protein
MITKRKAESANRNEMKIPFVDSSVTRSMVQTGARSEKKSKVVNNVKAPINSRNHVPQLKNAEGYRDKIIRSRASNSSLLGVPKGEGIIPLLKSKHELELEQMSNEKSESQKELVKDLTDFEDHIELYRAALETAYSDGVLTSDEDKMLKWIRERHGITMDEHRILMTQINDLEQNLDYMLEQENENMNDVIGIDIMNEQEKKNCN